MIVDLNLRGKLVIIIGCGNECLKKIEALSNQNCKILLICNIINQEIGNVIKKNENITVKKMKIDESNINKVFCYKPFLVMAATDNKTINKTILQRAKIHCNRYAVDDPDNSDFSHPAIITFNNFIQIAISTKKKSPLVSKQIKIKTKKIFKKIIKDEEIYKIKLQFIVRKLAKKLITSSQKRKKILYKIWNDKEITKYIELREFEEARSNAIMLLNDLR